MKYILEVNDATKKFSGLMANEAITFQVEPPVPQPISRARWKWMSV